MKAPLVVWGDIVAEIGEFQMATGVIRALQMQKPSTPRYRSALPLGSAKKRGVKRASLAYGYLLYIPCGEWL